MTTTNDRQLMQQALEALDQFGSADHHPFRHLCAALRDRLAREERETRKPCVRCGQGLLSDMADTCYSCAQKPARQEQEPVAWMWIEDPWGAHEYHFSVDKEDGWTPIYTAPQREWVGLTEEEIDAADKSVPGAYSFQHGKAAFARAIEAKLREKKYIRHILDDMANDAHRLGLYDNIYVPNSAQNKTHKLPTKTAGHPVTPPEDWVLREAYQRGRDDEAADQLRRTSK